MNREIIKLGVLVVAVIGLSACDFNEPTYMTTKKIQVEQSRADYNMSVHEFNDATAASIAHKYANTGEGPVRATVTYDPASSINTSNSARGHLARIVSALRKNDVHDVMGNIMPIHESAEDSRLLLTFDSYEAKAPINCKALPGLEDNNLNYDFDYELGCSRESILAKQIARPKDLLGQTTNIPVTDGRRGANIIEGYRTGVPNQPLVGEKASGD